MKKTFLIALIIILCFTTSCARSSLETYIATITKNDNATLSLEVEIAKTHEEKARGYMERKKIPEGTGMLFIFDRDQILSFWMKDTPTPLSIAYLDSKGTIKEIHDLTPFSLAAITSAVSCRYALEVPQGWFEKNDITVGSTISLP